MSATSKTSTSKTWISRIVCNAIWSESVAVCAILSALASIALGQTPFPSTTPGTLPPSPSYPSTPATGGSTAFPATTLPPVTSVPSPYSTPAPYTAPPTYANPPTYPNPTATYNPYAPTFRPSTAPVSTVTPAPSSFNQVYNSWMEWLTGNPTSGVPSAYGQPTYYGQPSPYSTSTFGVPAYGQPMAPATAPTSYPPAYSSPNPGVLFPGTPPTSYSGNPYAPNPYGSNPYAGNPYAGNPYAGSPYATGAYPPNPYPTSWNAWWYNTSSAVQAQTQQTMRLCQGLRFRYTYVPGNTDFGGVDANQIESHDFETSLVFAIPRIFGMSQPWYLKVMAFDLIGIDPTEIRVSWNI
ncbi:MAG: hypothetical protein ACKN85_00775, partial [Pirellula sp.]